MMVKMVVDVCTSTTSMITPAQWVDASLPGGGLTKDEADAIYLSKTVDDTAAGAITFESPTTHENSVNVTGGNVGIGVDTPVSTSLGR